jgi:hypothetical protein
MLPLDVSVLQQPVLPLDVPLLLQSMLYLGTSVCLFYSKAVCRLCTVPGGFCPAAACASPGRICSTAACAVPEDGLQQLVVHLDGVSTRASAAPRRVCLHELLCAPEVSVDCIETVLHLFVSVYKSFVLCLKSVCCICPFLSTRALFCACAYLQSTRVLCCTWTCLPTRVQCMLYLEEHNLLNFLVCFGFFRNSFVCFDCFDTYSKHRNKPKNSFFDFTKQTEKQPKQIVFRFFSVQTENKFCLFRGHPTCE